MEEDEGVCWATQAFPPSPPALPEPYTRPAIAEEEKERNLEINLTQHGEGSSSSSQWAELDVLLDSFTPQPASGNAAAPTATTTTTRSRGSVDYVLHAGLNAEQREAAEAPVDRPLLICAGPGTGKTLTLCHRIVDLVARQNVRPEAILAITFSRKAADEMRHRLDSLCPLTRPVTVSNFHRFCWRLLRLSRDACGSVGRDLEVIEKRRQAELIEECLELWSPEEEEKGNAEANDEEDSVDVEEEDDDGDEEEEPGRRRAKRRRLEAPSKESNERQARLTVNYFLQFIGRAKANLPLSQEYDEKWDARHRFVYAKYQERLEEEGLVDFHDMIRKSVQLLTTDPALLARYQQMFQVVLVDEFQDTSRLQWELVRLLAQPHKAVTVIGDPHQTIYSFRGTNFDNWKEFHRSFGEGALYLSLQQNYRSSKTILQAAQSVISNNPSPSASAVELGFALPYTRLHTANAQGNLVGLTVCEDWETEMRRVIATIKEKSRRKEYRYRDMCVLFRNFKSRGFSLAAFEEALAQRNVPYVISGADRDAAESSGWQPSTASGGESEVIVDCLSLIVDTNDTDESFIRVLHSTSAGTLMNGLRARAHVEGTSLFRAAKLYIATAGEKDDGHRIEVLRRIVKMVERTRAELLLDSWEEDESEERDDSASPARANKGPARAPRKVLADVIEAVARWLERVDDTDGDGEGDHQEQDQDSERDFLLTDSAAEPDQRRQSRAEFVNRLKQEASRYETTRRLDTEEYTFSLSLQELLADFVKQRASGSTGRHEGGGKQNAITLSTIHRAKGLEWPVVFLVQMNETVMPSWQALKSLLSPEGATEDEQRDQHTRALEEERRLCYVAMTRARERLFISFVNNSRGDAKVSRFVLEIPEGLVVANRVVEEERSDREESEDDDSGGGGEGSDISEGDEENEEEDDDGEEENGGVGGRLVRLFRPLKKRGLVPVKTADPVAQPSKRAKRRVIFVRSRRRSTTAEPLHAAPHGPASPPPALAPQLPPPPLLPSAMPAVADETTTTSASVVAMTTTTTSEASASEATTFPPARRFLRSSRTKRPPLVRPSTKDEQLTDDRDDEGENASDDDDDDDDESDEDDEADDDDEKEEEESDTPEAKKEKEKERHPHLPPARRYVSPNSKQNMKSRSRESVHGPAPPLVLL
ncbi:UvrD/REP helicase subfamily protein [Acanthamoeba castellanii str. Neff]|uniref:DNA 3'-5' helicase n=1 Tax=Acanthamoeba castellanii (strain ATCC 30010 / Neff) TaxID=1257118 RepID=L8HHC0_ACACF|nr:UvrD/REP helicase subfamily protein [Acanthamoeba castellanii str. Neff]ELR24570.1 UvrD/REP helicase subfamily protein [Acanthamoeba castellanii str. Neff]